MNKYDQMNAATKAGIRRAFWALYKQKDIGRITVNEVIARCGVNRSTFYRHYRDVYAVLEEIEDELLQKANTLSTGAATSYDDFDVFLRSAYAVYQQDREYLHYLVRERRDSAFANRYQSLLESKMPVVFMYDGSRIQDDALAESLELYTYGVVDIFIKWADDDRLPFAKLRELLRGVSLEGMYPTLLRVYNIRPIFTAEPEWAARAPQKTQADGAEAGPR